MKRILHLTIKKKWFDLIKSGKRKLNTENINLIGFQDYKLSLECQDGLMKYILGMGIKEIHRCLLLSIKDL